MFLERIEVIYRNSVWNFIVGNPIEAVLSDVRIKPDPDKIVKTIELTENHLKVEFGENEVTWLPLNKPVRLNFKKKE